MIALTPKQERFCHEYLKTGNASEAYRQAYEVSKMSPVTVNREAKRLLDNHKITTRLDELIKPAVDKVGITIQRVLKQAERLAFTDIGKLFNTDGTMKPVRELDDDTAATLASLEVVEKFIGKGESRKLIGYTKKAKLFDKNAALELLFKYLMRYDPGETDPIVPRVDEVMRRAVAEINIADAHE